MASFATENEETMINTAELHVLQNLLGLGGTSKVPSEIQDIAFVCVDCEAFEFAQHKITEIGVAVLDMRNIRGIAVDENGKGWLDHIACAHFRIQEYSHLVNKRWVKGDPEGFAFGQSTFISRRDAKRVLTQIFQDPSDLSGRLRAVEAAAVPRDIVIVGHNLRQDLAYLRHFNFSCDDDGIIVVKRMDTQTIAGGKKHQVGLVTLLQLLGVVPECSLHNAGNDAAYTLRALILMAIREIVLPGTLGAALQQYRMERKAASEARKAARELEKVKTVEDPNPKVSGAAPDKS